MSDQHFRLSDAERDQAAAELGEHYAQGRLSQDEHGERLDAIWAARTRGDLVRVFSDLPSPYFARTAPVYRGPAPARSSAGGWPAPWRRGLPAPLFVVLALLVVFTVLTHLPIILIGLLVWFFLISRHRRHHTVRRW
jgi:hypothetical protein